MKIKAYDKYNKQWIYIVIDVYDDLYNYWDSSSSKGIEYKIYINIESTEGDKDDCGLQRWSDLEKIELVDNSPYKKI